MANISQIKKLSYTITQADVDAGIAYVPVLWKSPFYDTNYAVCYQIEMPEALAALIAIFPIGMTTVTPAGFTAVFEPSGGAGYTITIHAIASHK